MRSVVLALLTLALAACGGTDGADSGDLNEAAEATTEAGSSRVSLWSSSTFDEKPVEIAMEGVFDYANERGKLLVTEDTLATHIGGFDYVPDEIRVLGDVLFERFEIKGRTVWRRDSPGGGLDPLSTLVPAPGGADPSDALGLVLASSDDVKKVGVETVRGVEATHYRARVNVQKLVDGMAAERRNELQASGVKFRDSLPVDVWTDNENRVVKLVLDGHAYSMEPEAKETTTLEFFDFGVGVDVEAPPADAIISDDEFDQLTGIADSVEGTAGGGK
jgi:hypothetical protein